MNILTLYKPEPNGWLTRERCQLINLCSKAAEPSLISVGNGIQEVHPGPDGIARTATMKTVKGSYVKSLSKLSILPIEA